MARPALTPHTDVRGGRPKSPARAYAAAATRAKRAEAERRELEVAVLRGTLVNRARVEARVAAWARRLRESLIRWPARIGAELAAATGADELALDRELEEHVHRLCADLAAESCDLDG